MRLWHYKLIPFLPKSQLLAQWRELNSIFKNQPKHILINYVYEYPKKDLLYYTRLVLAEMNGRGCKIKNQENAELYLSDVPLRDNLEMYPLENPDFHPFERHHDDEYLTICYFNLLEKYQRGQKDFDGEAMHRLAEYCEPIIERYMSHD